MATTMKEVEELVIPPHCFRRKLDGVLDCAPSDNGCKVLVGEVTHK